MQYRFIKINNAKENNLKNISVNIPQGILCGICGVSGAGKSTLAKNIIANSGYRNFAFSLPTYIRKKIYSGNKPNVISVDNLPPVYLLDIKTANRNNRSTVATMSGLMTILRNIFCDYNLDKFLEPRLFSYNISQENGGGACKTCNGTGVADNINENKLIAKYDKSIIDGGLTFVSDKGIKYTKVSEKFLEAFCREENIDINKPIKSFSEKEKALLFYGSDKIINFTDKTGANNGKKSLKFSGIVNILLDLYTRTKNKNIVPLIENGICPCCKGSRYNLESLSFKVFDKSISEILDMSISETITFFEKKTNARIQGLISEYLSVAKELENIGIGYLQLSRSIATVSGGELQRIKIAKNIYFKVFNSCFILDEPSSGLHPCDIERLLLAFEKIKKRNNTIIIVEHNPFILNQCDYLIEMGEKGGNEGGYVVFSGDKKDIHKTNTKTSITLRKKEYIIPEKQKNIMEHFILLRNIQQNNIDGIDLKVPLNRFIAVAGVSGSGKSSAINIALYSAIKKYINKKDKNEYLHIQGRIDNIIHLSQDIGTITARSSVATALNLLDHIRNIFASLPESKKLNFDKSFFNINSGLGLCTYCNGLGIIKDEDEETEEICPICEGKKFNNEVLKIKYKGYSIADILSTEMQILLDVFKDEDKIQRILKQCIEIGIGYLSLDRTLPSISKGELQRIRIVKEICDQSSNHTVFILDEPSKGLHDYDVEKIISAVKKLVEKDNTVIVIEHNLNVITRSDYVIEFGPEAGDNGGKIVFAGQPYELKKAKTKTSAVLNYVSDINTPQNDFPKNQQNDISIQYDSQEIVLKRCTINNVIGGIASGKSSIAKRILFGNSIKQYISATNAQGKYLTKDINYLKNTYTNNIPLTRLIDVSEKFYKKHERVSETLDFDSLISNMFYYYGKKQCAKCKKVVNIQFIGKCDTCQAEIDEIIFKNAFSYSKKSCKCSVCKGKGKLFSYDFNLILSNTIFYELMLKLLRSRTRIDRIAPLLKEKYGIDILKNYKHMTYDEKRIFLYGDKRLEVFYIAKQKKYIWDGCNELIKNNIIYADQEFFNKIKDSYKEITCPYCLGYGMNENILNISYKNITFKEFMFNPINWVYEKLCCSISLCDEEYQFLLFINNLITLNIGNIHLAQYISDLSIREKSIIQYLLYKFYPIDNTIIAWDDFSAGKNKHDIKKIIDDFPSLIEKGITPVIFDKKNDLKYANIVQLKHPKISFKENFDVSKDKLYSLKNNKYGCYIIHNTRELESVDRLNMSLYSKTTIGTVSNTVAIIKSIYKKKNNMFNYTRQNDNEKCLACNGQGFYELNSGILGLTKESCPICDGTGFSKKLFNIKVFGISYPYLINSDIDTVYDWAKAINNPKIIDSLKIFLDLGMGKTKYNKGLNEMSFNECSLVLIIKYLLENNSSFISLKDMFINIDSNDLEHFVSILNTFCENKGRKLKLLQLG